MNLKPGMALVKIKGAVCEKVCQVLTLWIGSQLDDLGMKLNMLHIASLIHQESEIAL